MRCPDHTAPALCCARCHPEPIKAREPAFPLVTPDPSTCSSTPGLSCFDYIAAHAPPYPEGDDGWTDGNEEPHPAQPFVAYRKTDGTAETNGWHVNDKAINNWRKATDEEAVALDAWRSACVKRECREYVRLRVAWARAYAAEYLRQEEGR